jgi:hypothetical protein
MSGVMLVTCGCCGEPKIVENVESVAARRTTGEEVFCEECLALPEPVAVLQIAATDAMRLGERLAVSVGRDLVIASLLGLTQ